MCSPLTCCTENKKTTEWPPNAAPDGNSEHMYPSISLFLSIRTFHPCKRSSLSLSAANICGPKRQQWKVFQVWVCLLLAGVINSGGALVRDLSTQIWITRQRNLARSNLCVWYLHESKRECETSAANNRNSHVFLLFGCFAARLCAFVKQHFHEHRDERQQHKED